jgi:hypothetical protein
VDFEGTAPLGIRISKGTPWQATTDERGLDMTWPRLLAGPAGEALVLEDYHNSSVALRWAHDEVWDPIIDVRAVVSVDDAWTRTFSHWEAVDAWGQVHLLVGGERQGPMAGPPDRVAMEYAHVVFQGGKMVQEQRLTTDPPLQLARLPAGQVVVSSDYGGLAFEGERGYLAWPEAGGIAITQLSPT